MPLYFVLSGFFFKAYEPKVFLIKKINNIVIPFLFWLTISDIWRVCFNLFYNHNLVDFTLVQFIKAPLYRFILSNGALWFLICLFTTNIMFCCISSICKNDNKKVCFVILFCALSAYLLYRNEVKLPLWIDSSLVALPFFFFGHCCRNMFWFKSEFSIKKSFSFGVGFIIISYGVYYIFNHVYILISENIFHGSPIMGYVNSVAFVMGVLLLCRVVRWLPIVSYFGRYSIIVLCIHMPIISFLPKLIEFLGYKIVPIWVFTVVLMLICWFAIPICKKWLPYFVAQKPLLKV